MAELVASIRSDNRGGRQFRRETDLMRRSARNLGREVNRTETALDKFGARARTVGLSGAVFAAGFAITGAVRGAVSAIGEYERGLARARSVTGNFGGQLKEAEALIRSLGETTVFTAGEVAQGAAFLGQTGFEAQEIFAALGPSLDLAVAGQLDLAKAADIASNVLKQFNLDASETRRVVDVLANTAASSNTNIEQLGEALKLVGPIAASLGVSIEQAAAAVGVLSDAGIQATLTGTQLRQILLSLAGPSNEAADAVVRAGTSLDALNVSANGLDAVLQELSESQINAATGADIFQRRAVTGALVLQQNIETYLRLARANEEAAGTAERLARIAGDNLVDDFNRAKAAAEGFVLSLDGLSDGIKSVLSFSTNLFRALSGQTIPEIAKAGDISRAAAGGFVALASAIESVASALALLAAASLTRFLTGQGALLAARSRQWLRFSSSITQAERAIGRFSTTLAGLFLVFPLLGRVSGAALAPLLGIPGILLAAGAAFVLFTKRTEDAAAAYGRFRDELSVSTGGLVPITNAQLEEATRRRDALQAEVDRLQEQVVRDRQIAAEAERAAGPRPGGLAAIDDAATSRVSRFDQLERDLADANRVVQSGLDFLERNVQRTQDQVTLLVEKINLDLKELGNPNTLIGLEDFVDKADRELIRLRNTDPARIFSFEERERNQDVTRAFRLAEQQIDDEYKRIAENISKRQKEIEKQLNDGAKTLSKEQIARLFQANLALSEGRDAALERRDREQALLRGQLSSVIGPEGLSEQIRTEQERQFRLERENLIKTSNERIALLERQDDLTSLERLRASGQIELNEFSRQLELEYGALEDSLLAQTLLREKQAEINARIRAEQIQREKEVVDQFRGSIEQAFNSGFEGAQKFDEVLAQLGIQFLKLTIQVTTLKPLLDTLFGEQGGSGSGLLGPLFSGLLGLAGGAIGGVTAPQTAGQLGLGSVPDVDLSSVLDLNEFLGSPHGGSMEVPGPSGGGYDNRIVAFAASGGERIRVTPPSQKDRAGSSAPPVVNVKVINQSGAQATVREREIDGIRDVEVFISRTTARDARQNGPAFRAIQSESRGPTR